MALVRQTLYPKKGVVGERSEDNQNYRLVKEAEIMPFKKIGRNKFRSPSGRVFTRKQVRLYYARGGKF